MSDKKTPKRDYRREWHYLEREVSHYYLHEEGVAAQNFDPKASQATDPAPPRFPLGADYATMMTAISRLREADKIMPCVKLRVVRRDEGIEKTSDEMRELRKLYREFYALREPCSATLPVGYTLEGSEQPSASMVLRCAYGVKSCKYDDSAPDGERLLKMAREAYCDAAKLVPARVRASRMEKLQARFDRAFGGGE